MHTRIRHLETAFLGKSMCVFCDLPGAICFEACFYFIWGHGGGLLDVGLAGTLSIACGGREEAGLEVGVFCFEAEVDRMDFKSIA
jgi:hypothetical protein